MSQKSLPPEKNESVLASCAVLALYGTAHLLTPLLVFANPQETFEEEQRRAAKPEGRKQAALIMIVACFRWIELGRKARLGYWAPVRNEEGTA